MIIGATPARLLTLVVVFCGATSSTAGDVGYVLLLPLSAALFHTPAGIRSQDWRRRSRAYPAGSPPTCCFPPPIFVFGLVPGTV